VNWSAPFDSYSEGSSPHLYLILNQGVSSFYVFAHVPQSHSEMARELRKGDLVQVRGVMTEISYSECTLDYVDWARSESTTEAIAPTKADPAQAKVTAVEPTRPAEESKNMHDAASSSHPILTPPKKSWWTFGLG
jgi:hypothetical protein